MAASGRSQRAASDVSGTEGMRLAGRERGARPRKRGRLGEEQFYRRGLRLIARFGASQRSTSASHSLAAGVVFDLVARDAVDGEVAGLRDGRSTGR